jgi:hypothetical protein
LHDRDYIINDDGIIFFIRVVFQLIICIEIEYNRRGMSSNEILLTCTKLEKKEQLLRATDMEISIAPKFQYDGKIQNGVWK